MSKKKFSAKVKKDLGVLISNAHEKRPLLMIGFYLVIGFIVYRKLFKGKEGDRAKGEALIKAEKARRYKSKNGRVHAIIRNNNNTIIWQSTKRTSAKYLSDSFERLIVFLEDVKGMDNDDALGRARTIEKLYRLKTDNFSSRLFKNTMSAGMVPGTGIFGVDDELTATKFFGWSRQDTDMDKIPSYMSPYGLFNIMEDDRGSERKYISFPGLFPAMVAINAFLDDNSGWGSIDNALELWGGYPEFVNEVWSMPSTIVDNL